MIFKIKVPATSANLGPGFDALGLALDLWNETTITLAIEFSMRVRGEGADKLSNDKNNLIFRAAERLADFAGRSLPAFHADCINQIPLSSGMGSSAAAMLTGLLAANTMLGKPLLKDEILDLAAEMEGHSDNVAAALLGGLVVSTMDEGKVIAHKVVTAENIPPVHITVVLPDYHLPTREARAALPSQVAMKDAVYNISRAILVTEAFRNGDLNLLGKTMNDALHQPYRLKLIPGAQSAMNAAKEAGAGAVVLSGAGPSLIAFSSQAEAEIGDSMKRAFEAAGLLNVRVFNLKISSRGAEIQI
jgi:homoserine kinase